MNAETDGKGPCVYCLRADFHTPDCPTQLRARAEKAEAEARREFESGNDWCRRAIAAERERDRLQDGVQALADEAGIRRFVPVADLRALLSPTPEGQETK